ncbi:hypothetical protein NDU88_009218, partial [Pleurodeles waltl]
WWVCQSVAGSAAFSGGSVCVSGRAVSSVVGLSVGRRERCLQWWQSGREVPSVVGLSVGRGERCLQWWVCLWVGESGVFSGGSVSGSGALRCLQWWICQWVGGSPVSSVVGQGLSGVFSGESGALRCL